ncbi:MAG: hypothetical protein BWX96_03348 [Bacteroidetes bacterium ADurb.Bin145]|jgi:hypothetical protein|nr:MAG: hypothetical protein BWX96_03348 [Bacteroidetes bacterium ADurb.Bin145]
MDDNSLSFILVVFFITILSVIILFFFIILRLFRVPGKSGGYETLVEFFITSREPSGIQFSRQSIAFGKVWYKNCMRLVSSEDGLFISPGFPVRLISFINPGIGKDIFIPWEYLRFIQKSQAFWTDVYEYEITGEIPVRCTFSKQVADTFPEYVKPVI